MDHDPFELLDNLIDQLAKAKKAAKLVEDIRTSCYFVESSLSDRLMSRVNDLLDTDT